PSQTDVSPLSLHDALPISVEAAIHLGQVLRRDEVLRILVEPDRGRDPPARPVPKQLDAVDAAAYDRSVRCTPLFIGAERVHHAADRKSTRLNSSHVSISYA